MRLYLSLVTGHAVIMVFLAYVPVYYGVFTNYLIPIQLGARDFPAVLVFFFKLSFKVPGFSYGVNLLPASFVQKVFFEF